MKNKIIEFDAEPVKTILNPVPDKIIRPSIGVLKTPKGGAPKMVWSASVVGLSTLLILGWISLQSPTSPPTSVRMSLPVSQSANTSPLSLSGSPARSRRMAPHHSSSRPGGDLENQERVIPGPGINLLAPGLTPQSDLSLGEDDLSGKDRLPPFVFSPAAHDEKSSMISGTNSTNCWQGTLDSTQIHGTEVVRSTPVCALVYLDQ
jgi:hypothetical protein